MGSPWPVVSGRRAVKVFGRAEFEFLAGRGKGSHMVMFRKTPPCLLTIPDHRELDRGTLRGLIRAAGITVEQFVTLEREV
jgi:predicted RNA binding protein YcfA (HicA-like mRNA interferase family)